MHNLGKLFESLGVLLISPLLIDILMPTVFNRSTEEIFRSIEAWASMKAEDLYKLSLPREMIVAARRIPKNTVSKSASASLILAVTSFVLFVLMLSLNRDFFWLPEHLSLAVSVEEFVKQLIKRPVVSVFLLVGLLGIVLRFFFLQLGVFLDEPDEESPRSIFGSRVKYIAYSIIALFLAGGLLFIFKLMSDITEVEKLSISQILLFFVLFFAAWIVYFVLVVMFGYNENSGGIVTFAGFYVALVLFSGLTIVFLLFSFLLHALLVIPSRYFLFAVSTKGTKWILAFTGACFELLGIWLS